MRIDWGMIGRAGTICGAASVIALTYQMGRDQLQVSAQAKHVPSSLEQTCSFDSWDDKIPASYGAELFVADFDRDGDQDIIYHSWNTEDGYHLRLCENRWPGREDR